MTARKIRQIVREWAEVRRFESRRDFLHGVAEAMKAVRALPAAELALSSPIIDVDGALELLLQDDALGQTYQAMNAPALETAYRGTARERRKFTDDEIPVVTQLFTPRWVVEFLLHNSLGRLWLDLHPDSRLRDRLNWLVDFEPAIESPGVASLRSGDLRVCDPACGTMNFGLVAIELLAGMYREEIDRAGRPGWPAEPSIADAAGASAAAVSNLVGIDLDPLAVELARLTLEIKIGGELLPEEVKLWRGDALFEPEVESKSLGRFHVVVTNPPYLSSRNLPAEQVRKMKHKYRPAWRDAGACFLQRCLDFLAPGARAGVLAMQSFMFTGAFESLRRDLASRAAVEAIAHFGPGLFDVGNPGTLQTAAVVLRRELDPHLRGDQRISAIRLIDAQDKAASLAAALRQRDVFHIRQQDMASLPRGAWSYWATADVRKMFHALPKLADVAPPRQGLATTDNARFVRYWWEVDGLASPEKWRPYVKGGRFRRWYEASRHRVNWEDDGREIKQSIVERYPYLEGEWQWVAKNSAFYGRGGVTYSYLTSGVFSARLLAPGAIFDVAGSSLFPDDPLPILALLNSTAARRLLEIINPTVNFQVGDLRQLPVPVVPAQSLAILRTAVSRAVELQRRLDAFDETTTDFLAPLNWENADAEQREIISQRSAVEAEIDTIVSELYGLAVPAGGMSKAEVPPVNREELAARWLSFALRTWQRRTQEAMLPTLPPDKRAIQQIRECLGKAAGEASAAEIEQTLGGLHHFLARDFFRWHFKLYKYRPIWWGLAGSRKALLVWHGAARAPLMKSLISRLGGSLPVGWDRFPDDGISINLAPLAVFIADPKLQRSLAKVKDDLGMGRHAFAETGKRVGHFRETALRSAYQKIAGT